MDILGGSRDDARVEADVPEPLAREIAHKENLHSYMVFAPLLFKRKHGTHFSASMFVAFAIFLLNLLLQLSLTLIAGGFIMGENSDFFNSLITGDSVDSSALLWEGYHAVLDPMEWWSGAHSIATEAVPMMNGNSSSSCCTGPACAQEKECCAPNRPVGDDATTTEEPSAADADFLTDANLLETHRPRGRSSGGNKGVGKNSRGRGDMSSVRKERAVCTLEGETLDCSPPSSAFAAYWSELDADGDGRWTREEAVADVQNLGCRLGVATEEVFRHACRSIVSDAEDSARVLSQGARSRSRVHLPAELVERREITLDYFNWWRGLVAICIHIDAARCGELVQEGIFEGAMAPELGGSRGGVVDLDSAIEYCTRILRPGGLCDVVLPGTFLMFRDRVQEKCGEKMEEVGPRIINPFKDTDARYITQVNYHNVADYSTVHTMTFRFFLFLVLIMWYLRLLDEFKECFDYCDFVWNFPMGGGGELEDSDEGKLRSGNVESGDPEAQAPCLDRIHRAIVAGTTLVRFWLVVYLANIGTVYHLSTHAYVDLLLNAIALAFIFELPEFVYAFLVADDAKKEVEELESFSFTTSMPQGNIVRRIASKAFMGLAVIPFISFFVVVYNDIYRTQPVLEALQCTCLLSGDRCLHVGRFPKTWWDSHWGEVSGLDQIPAQALLAQADDILAHDSVTLNQEALSALLPSWEIDTQRLEQDAPLMTLSSDANSTAQANATALPDFLLQTTETEKPLVTPTTVQRRPDATLRSVEEHVANAAGLLQIEHIRDQSPKRVHDVSEL